MRVTTAYHIEKNIAKINIHALDMLVWHMLRWWLNKRLPEYYTTHPSKAGKSCDNFTKKRSYHFPDHLSEKDEDTTYSFGIINETDCTTE